MDRSRHMRQGLCRYEIFCEDATPYDPVDVLVNASIDLRRLERPGHQPLFRGPLFSAPADSQPSRLRRPIRDGAPEIDARIQKVDVCYVISAVETDPEHHEYLEAAILLAADIAWQRRGVVVDRTADIGYTADQLFALGESLAVRDMVALDEHVAGDKVKVRTRGMVKFAQRDFVVEDFPVIDLELARRLLYDNVCHYAAAGRTILPGQNMHYLRSDPGAKWYFCETADGALRITDCHPTEKRPLDGLGKYLEVARPMLDRLRPPVQGEASR